ncbi:TadE/TadG family type IV pilus assembly protein [Bradyrhizobium sp. AZCC 2289]|uniref:TadE/TadG family type IV pilus assembly protein n=1 Tax=Bradyrhizobium sp. AZCC 2289 TaxID=3117026 RepID=UPI002FF0D539
MPSFFRLIDRFRRDKRANVAMIFGIAVVPLISAMGCAVDYSMATRMRAKLQSAADAASVASLSQKSAGFTAAALMSSDGSVTAGVTEANNIFDGNVGTITGYTNLTRTSVVTKTGIKLTSNVSFSADVPTNFMRVVGFQKLTVTGVSKSTASLPPYLDFYLALDVSGSMGLPSTPAEAVRMQSISPDNWVQYRTGCTLACHFAPQKSACVDPPVTPPAAPASNPATNSNYSQQYNTNNYCMGYVYSRLSQSALSALINQASTSSVKKQVPGLPVAMLSGLNTTVTPGSPNSLITGNTSSLPYSLTAATSCPTDGTDACIQLRLDAVGFALTQLFIKANADEKVTDQFRIGLYPFITDIDKSYSPLTKTINGSASTPGTINYAAANLATELDTNLNATLGSGGTHIDNALNSLNNLIVSVGDGSTSSNTQPFIFLVTDGAQDNQYKDVNGSWHGSNHATVLTDLVNAYPGICTTIKNRGIIISVLNIPYQTINPVNTTFAGDEDDYANNNIPNIAPSLQACASPNFYFSAGTPTGINDALKKMFDQALKTAHITN